ncbi:MAG: type III pantothenate kinase [Chitinophagaceae bacterium]
MAPVTLCFDFGNTRLKVAVFEGDKIKTTIVLPDDSTESIQQLITEYKPEKSILSSVVNHNKAIEELLASKTKFHLLNHLSKLAFTTPVGKPETIGADRLALVAAAVHFYPERHNLVIGMGTCITYNFVNKFHEFLGGGISPGLEMRLKSLNHYTAKLPVIKADSNVPLIGYDTATNILSGVILGIVYELQGFISEYSRIFDRLNVLINGGDMVYLAPHLNNELSADPDLIFKGLYGISETNNS